MQDHCEPIGEDELALIHALQLRPRASWTELGAVLGVDPVTAARRWSRLRARGAAWVTVSPGPRLLDRITVAYVEIDCAAGEAATVAARLATHPHMVTIERTASAQRLFTTVAAADLAAMSRYTLDILPTLPHIGAVHASLVTHMFAEGGDWRIDALDPAQRTRLTAPPARSPADRDRFRLTEVDRALLGLLARDGRTPYAELAAALAVSTSTVKRRVDDLTGLGLFRFRCDFARPLGGWPVAVTFRATVPAADLPRIGHAVVALPQTRNCAATTGTHNLLVQAGLHTMSDVLRFENTLTALHPAMTIAERVITLRHDKLLGHLLDRYGRTESVVAADIWSEPGA
ncbi:Lrp/AsnC family transcriptional regulator [Nocardia otitidiscaviarum]|uniref:Lrp/AsnC family transcriptional regulator n=1 Tax=Nocardia otitidiscaviarum TaxID=1823 RepID=A0A516NJL7_9NOCA|nr:AsnC family transcriptional regulator [Nocardia otitidiscaviarum]MCP9618871.1 AsnC family transcriptional regulator [Nocardia otitidiscaviarum]QDP79104.1 Lrp/AsnC family transcriptional regulator [Nocardia otitidiscaviarum]